MSHLLILSSYISFAKKRALKQFLLLPYNTKSGFYFHCKGTCSKYLLRTPRSLTLAFVQTFSISWFVADFNFSRFHSNIVIKVCELGYVYRPLLSCTQTSVDTLRYFTCNELFLSTSFTTYHILIRFSFHPPPPPKRWVSANNISIFINYNMFSVLIKSPGLQRYYQRYKRQVRLCMNLLGLGSLRGCTMNRSHWEKMCRLKRK